MYGKPLIAWKAKPPISPRRRVESLNLNFENRQTNAPPLRLVSDSNSNRVTPRVQLLPPVEPPAPAPAPAPAPIPDDHPHPINAFQHWAFYIMLPDFVQVHVVDPVPDRNEDEDPVPDRNEDEDTVLDDGTLGIEELLTSDDDDASVEFHSADEDEFPSMHSFENEFFSLDDFSFAESDIYNADGGLVNADGGLVNADGGLVVADGTLIIIERHSIRLLAMICLSLLLFSLGCSLGDLILLLLRFLIGDICVNFNLNFNGRVLPVWLRLPILILSLFSAISDDVYAHIVRQVIAAAWYQFWTFASNYFQNRVRSSIRSLLRRPSPPSRPPSISTLLLGSVQRFRHEVDLRARWITSFLPPRFLSYLHIGLLCFCLRYLLTVWIAVLVFSILFKD